MPAKASYILASREGESKAKWELIQEYRGEKQKKIDELEEILEWLYRKGRHLSSKEVSRLKGLESLCSSLFSLVKDK